MFGTVVTGAQLIELQKNNVIQIEGFSEDKIHAIHYPLYPSSFHRIIDRKANGESKIEQIGTYSGSAPDFFNLGPRQHVLVRVRELVVFPNGLIAQFVAPHELIRNGFVLQSGRAQAPFGSNGERLVFSITNMLDVDNAVDYSSAIAYMYFFDLRGLRDIPNGMSEADLKQMRRWFAKFSRDSDSGPSHES